MPRDQVDIPALPVLLPLGIVLMVVAWACLLRRGLITGPRLGAAWLAGWYSVAVLGATMLPLHVGWGDALGPPDIYRITLIPLAGVRVDDFVLNVVMTLPLAAFLHVVFAVRDKARVILVGFLISAVIETTQAILDLTLHGDRWADVNDVMANTLGALLGYLAVRGLMRFEKVRRVMREWAIPDREKITKG